MIGKWLAFYGAQFGVAMRAFVFRFGPVDALPKTRSWAILSLVFFYGLNLFILLLSDPPVEWAIINWLLIALQSAFVLFAFWISAHQEREYFWRFTHAFSLIGIIFLIINFSLSYLLPQFSLSIILFVSWVVIVYSFAIFTHIAIRVFSMSVIRAAGTLAICNGLNLLFFELIAVLPASTPQGAS